MVPRHSNSWLEWVAPGKCRARTFGLLDLNLPKVDGPQVLREFRKHPECSDTPVIVITSSDAREDRARMEELRVARYFRKPSDYGAFLRLGAVVREVAGRM